MHPEFVAWAAADDEDLDMKADPNEVRDLRPTTVRDWLAL